MNVLLLWSVVWLKHYRKILFRNEVDGPKHLVVQFLCKFVLQIMHQASFVLFLCLRQFSSATEWDYRARQKAVNIIISSHSQIMRDGASSCFADYEMQPTALRFKNSSVSSFFRIRWHANLMKSCPTSIQSERIFSVPIVRQLDIDDALGI